MKNLLRIGLLGLTISYANVACNTPKTSATGADTIKVDSVQKDITNIKPDTAKADTVKK